jgi:hypothetical protein
MALDLLRSCYAKVFTSPSKDQAQCVFARARILERQGRYELCEVAYRKAIEDFRDLGETKQRLECQLLLSDSLSKLEACHRYPEALQLMVETLVGYFTSATTLLERMNIINSMRRLHSNMGLDSKNLDGIEQVDLFSKLVFDSPAIQFGRSANDYFNVWRRFVRMGVECSKRKLFGAAELCFGFPLPPSSAVQELGLMRAFELTCFTGTIACIIKCKEAL